MISYCALPIYFIPLIVSILILQISSNNVVIKYLLLHVWHTFHWEATNDLSPLSCRETPVYSVSQIKTVYKINKFRNPVETVYSAYLLGKQR